MLAPIFIIGSTIRRFDSSERLGSGILQLCSQAVQLIDSSKLNIFLEHLNDDPTSSMTRNLRPSQYLISQVRIYFSKHDSFLRPRLEYEYGNYG